MPRLFNTDDKIGVFCDSFNPRIEKRNGEEAKVIDLTLRVQPLTQELAATIAGGENLIKKMLFKMTDGHPMPNVKSVAFDIGLSKQLLTVFAAPDTEVASIAFDQVEISDIRARKEKGVDGWGLVFYASLGPLSRNELEFVVRWYTNQQFVIFAEAQPSLDLQSDQEQRRPEPEFEDPRDDSPATADAKRETGARQRVISHQHKGGKPNGSGEAHA